MEKKDKRNHINFLSTFLRGVIMLFCLLVATKSVQAQLVEFSAGYPKFDEATLVTLEGERTLTIRFVPKNNPLVNAKVEITLPQDVDETGVSAITPGLTLTSSRTGQTLTINVTSNGGTINQNDDAQLEVKVKANCRDEGPTNFTVKVLSGTDAKATKTMTINVLRPNLMLDIPQTNIAYTSATQQKTITCKLKTTSEHKASSAKVTFTVSDDITLSQFKLNTTTLTPSVTTAAGMSTYTLTFPTVASLGGTKIDQSDNKVITFVAKGSSTTCGVQTISSTVQYPHNTVCGTINNGLLISLLIPGANNLPKLTTVSCDYITSMSGGTVVHPTDIPVDGTTWVWTKSVFTNNSAAPISKLYVACGSDGVFGGCFDRDNIFVQVNNGTPRKIIESDYVNRGGIRSDSQRGFVSPGFNVSGKYTGYAEFKITQTVLPGESFTVWVKTLNGFREDPGTRDVYHFGIYNIPAHSFSCSIFEVEGFCGNKSAKGVGAGTSPKPLIARYLGKPLKEQFKQVETRTIVVRASLGQVDKAPTTFTVKVPSWLTIQSIKLTPDAGGTGSFPAGITVDPPTISANEGSIRTSSTITMHPSYQAPFLHIECRSNACSMPLTNRTDTIRYTIKQEWPGGTKDKISQVSQPVTHICKIEGITIDSFTVRRITRGYKDVDNDGNPDVNTPALDNEIEHAHFAGGDKGYFYMEATVEAGAPFNYIYVPMTSDNSNLTIGQEKAFFIPDNTAEVLVNGTPHTFPVTFVNPDPNVKSKGYFRIQTNGLSQGDKLKIPLKFSTPYNMKANYGGNITTGLQVSNNSSIDPFTNPGTGSDIASTNLWYHGARPVFTEGWNSSIIFENRIPKTGSLTNIHVYVDGNYNFPKEARYYYYLDKVTYKLPNGFTMDDSITVAKGGVPSLLKKIASESGSTNTERVYDVGKLYQKNPTGSISGGLWRLWKDRWTLVPTGTLRVDPALVEVNKKYMMDVEMVYYDVRAGKYRTNKGEVALIYRPTVKLALNVDTAASYGKKTTGPRITLTNMASNQLKNVWFYFDGPVENVSINDLATSTDYPSSGYKGRWVKGPDMLAGSEKNFQPTYTSMVTDCNGNNVDVYMGAWPISSPPDITQPLSPNDDYFIEKKAFSIKPVNKGKIESRIEVPNTKLQEAESNPANAYSIMAELNSNSSVGMVKNLEMKLVVPRGQLYVANSAEIEYPIGTRHSLGGALETALTTALGGSTDQERTVSLKLNDNGLAALGNNLTLSGNTLSNPNERVIRIHLKFRAMCETDVFKKMQYKVIPYGKTVCGQEAEGSDVPLVSNFLEPDVDYDYDFEKIKISSLSGSYAFNEGWTKDTLVLEIHKITGYVLPMKQTDYLEVLMPKDVNIDGDSIWYMAKPSEGKQLQALNRRDPITANAVAGNLRTIKLPFPVDEYNAVGNSTPPVPHSEVYGVGSKILCKIPVKYTPNGQARKANPIDSVQAAYRSEVKFGTCPPKETWFGKNTRHIALFTAIQYPHIAWLGDTARFEITSRGFDGKWYNQKTGTPAASSDNPWVNVPTDTAMVGDTVFYFTPVINGTSYGDIRLPYRVRIWLRPWFIKNLDAMKYVCAPQDTLFVKAGGMDVSYKWYKDGVPIAGATDTFLVVKKSGKYHVMVNDTVTPPNIISSDTMTVYFREMPVITKDLKVPLRDCDRLSYDLGVETKGVFLSYQWYRNGEAISGANRRTYRAWAKDSSAFYRVTVKNPCGDSISSRQIYISFCDEKVVGIARNIQLFVPNTAETIPSSKGMLYVNSQDDFFFTVKAKKGYSVKYLHVTTDSPIWTEFSGGIERTMISDSVMKVRIRIVTQNLKVTLSGISPVDNVDITDNVHKIWGYKDKLYVETQRRETVYIYTVMGQLYRREEVQPGLNTFDMESGYYFIRLSGGASAKVFIE